MTQGIGTKSSERWDVVNPRQQQDFPLSAPRGETIHQDRSGEHHHRHVSRDGFNNAERAALDALGVPYDRGSAFFPPGEEGARQYLHYAEMVTGGDSGLMPRYLRDHPGQNDPRFAAEVEEYRTSFLLAGTTQFLGGMASSAGVLSGAQPGAMNRRTGSRNPENGNQGPNGPGGHSGPGRHGGGGGGAPRGPHGSGGGTATATIPETLRGAGAQRSPAANTVTSTGGRLGGGGAPQASLLSPQAGNALPQAAAQFALGEQQRAAQLQAATSAPTEHSGLIPVAFGENVARGTRAVDATRDAPVDEAATALRGGANVGASGARSGTSGVPSTDEFFGLSDMPVNPDNPLAPGSPEARAAEQREAAADLRRYQREAEASFAEYGGMVTSPAETRDRLNAINAGAPRTEQDFVRAGRVADALPETLGPEGFAAYEEIMSDPIWRSALEEQAHKPRFLEFVQSIIRGDIDPRVAINRLRNDDPDTVGAPPLTGLSRGREWDIPDVERLLRPNEQDAFRRYAEANPDVVEIVVEAGYDASAAEMAVAIRALLNGAYGQDVAAWLRSGGAAGGRVPPGGNTPYVGTGAEFPEPEKQPETPRIIVPGAPNTEALPPDYQFDPDDPDNLIIVPEEVGGTSQIDTTTPLHTLTPAELLRNARLSRAAGDAPRDQIQAALGPGTTVVLRSSRDFGNYHGPVHDGHVHDGFTLNTTAGLQILGLDPAEFADLPGVGAGTYDTSWDANLPQDNVFETVQRYNDRVHAYYQQMGGFSNSFAVRPIISDPQTYESSQTGNSLPAYYVARRENQNLIGLLRFDWERGVAYSDEMISDRYGVPTIMPIEMPIELAEEMLGHRIPRDTEFIEYYQAPVGCELHYGTVDDNRAMLFNSMIMMMFYDEQYPNDNIFDYKVIGTMSGVPYQPEASNAIYETSHAINQLSDKLGVPRDRTLVNQGETNLSKENIHTASGSLHIADWTPEVWAHANEYMDSLAGTGQAITIHCDLRQAVDVEPGAIFNQWPPSLATFFTESQVSNREHIVRLANEHPDGIFVHAHTGLNVTGPVRPDHADDLRWMLENAEHDNLYFDMSWAAVYMSYAEFAERYGELIKDYPDRFVWGSDNLPQFATDGESPTIGVLEQFFNTGVTENLSQEEMERLFAQNYEDVFIAGGRRHGEWRADPANAEWLATREPGDFTPPKVWTRDADGEFHFIDNPAYQAAE